MRAFAMIAALMAGLSGTALAQGTSSSGSGAIHGQNWTMGQDLNNARNTAPQPGTLAADRARRADRQRQLGQNFDGTGRPTTNVPAPTPQAR
jgi:hypothetical protein